MLFRSKDEKARLLRNNSQIKSGGITIDDLRKEFVENKIKDGKKPVPSNIVNLYINLIKNVISLKFYYYSCHYLYR